MKSTRLIRLLALAHGTYLLIGGLWPLIDLPGFEAVTGPKQENWLVRSVAGLLLVAALILLTQLRKPRMEASAIAMAMGASLTLAMVGIITAASGIISTVYFMDGIIHVLFVACWCAAIVRAVWQGRRTWLDLPTSR
jgi:putative copper export protein